MNKQEYLRVKTSISFEALAFVWIYAELLQKNVDICGFWNYIILISRIRQREGLHN